MFSAIRRATISTASARGFSTTSSRAADLAKLILIGRLGQEPQVRTTKNEKEYVVYSVATTNYPPTPTDPEDPSSPPRTTWHRILSFSPFANNYLRNIPKGSLVYVEANYELREPDPSADPDSPAGQRQIFLRHDQIRLLKSSKPTGDEDGENGETQ